MKPRLRFAPSGWLCLDCGHRAARGLADANAGPDQAQHEVSTDFGGGVFAVSMALWPAKARDRLVTSPLLQVMAVPG